MKWYLKGYYWYKNLWDEILLLWVINRIFKNNEIDVLYIEAWNIEWLNYWLKKNSNILDVDISLIHVVNRIPFFSVKWVYFFWWWEVLTSQRPFPYDWRLYVVKYLFIILFWKFNLLWWIWKVNSKLTDLLYKILLPRANKIILRDKYSFEIVNNYTNNNSLLYRDFALDVFDIVSTVWCPKCLKDNNFSLINANPYIKDTSSRKSLFKFLADNSENIYFVPWDIWEDIVSYKILKSECEKLKIYDRTVSSVFEIYSFFSCATNWLWARLHFLLLLKYLSIPMKSIAYQDKVTKLIDLD